ncbi:GGDEF domain-containing protein [Shewanella sp. D64]|uniref:diguanylate cyclase DgcS n=1 Tax=unclassified Shewanella TaxID=196818 RepID=UPI0022BA4B51|nr:MULTISPECIES: GGDEF domain-containing protein [unclassified Shewanella]MEC4727063.1 GGDEF domain-containing protein [Shewanella sp. D64]MEC4737802.1 GGDEF domain-containing protein [Shewanella sp. E94]WBJ93941.1 GGDEF domain-containing protein [Shewanella sp. MTB7]
MDFGLATEFSPEEYRYQPAVHQLTDIEPNLVRIIQHLHESLDPRTVFACFGKIMGQHLPIEGVKLTFNHHQFNWGCHQGIQVLQQVNFSGNVYNLSYVLRKPLTPSQSELLKLMQTLVLLPLFNAIKYQEISRKAMYDSLTNLGNRHYYAESLKKAIATSTRHDSPLSIIVLDLDNFKNLNDSHGHLLGDEVLSEFGQLLTLAIRDTDQAFRVGGDEFVVIVRGDTCAASTLCERVLSSISTHSLFEKYQAETSLGVSQWQEGETAASVFERADKALYLAKSNGRRCFKIA